MSWESALKVAALYLRPVYTGRFNQRQRQTAPIIITKCRNTGLYAVHVLTIADMYRECCVPVLTLRAK